MDPRTQSEDNTASNLVDTSLLGAVVPDAPAQLPSYEVVLKGNYASIAPISPSHAEDLYELLQGPENESLFDYLFDDPYQSVEDLRTMLARKAATTNPWTYAILLNSPSSRPKAVGMASLMRMDLPNRVIEVGSILYTRPLQRTPAATEAMYLLARYVFETLGFRRKHMIAKGRNRDTAWYSMLDEEWPMVKNALEQWLNSENFDSDGIQKKPLGEFMTDWQK
ncbi:hypothetical protein SAPIO_CDS8036 [Scedosporium apiospermum]|uniref:N-acetyltransferase domain-containing protein n=1 Tax=Pseudallescheria apiosperma TaxID=563466 RepID=A0A084G0D7_PSEDA|nr:uncharacterized protein SAPIO_CDS8036 [Scedosporium apiospermum]KEZ40799.1 hypothetical protein SAPIO_CDS8036 [Scedosporium apiospermum]